MTVRRRGRWGGEVTAARPRRRVAGCPRLFALACGFVALAGLGCASTGRHDATGPSASPPASGAAAAPWELPAGAVPSQRLYQGSYEGPEGGGTFRATLRLAAPDRFRLDAADRLGRLLWTVGVDGGAAWWVDHRAGVWCPDLALLALPGLGRGPVPAAALPAMLLGVLPARPAEPTTPPSGDGDLELADAAGRRWRATLAGGRVTAWTVADGDQPVWWWRRQGKGGILSQRQGRQLRWQEVVVEPLRGELPPRAIPDGVRESCDEPPPP